MSIAAISVLLGSAFLLAALPAVTADETIAAPMAVPKAHATIHCPGITSVPMTSDAVQALPLHLLRTLSCGEPVAVLSDTGGHTVYARAADGKDGYVPRMYLNLGGSPAKGADHRDVSASPVNNVLRWQAGAPGCDQFMSKGHTAESATADGVTVQVFLEDSGWKLRATVAVSNGSVDTVELFPGLVTLDELQPHLKALLAQDPGRRSHIFNHQVFFTMANAQPSPSAVASHQGSPPSTAAATYHSPIPDYFNHGLLPSPTGNRATIVPSASELQSLALKHVVLVPGQTTAGVVWFERDGNARELSLRVPVGDLVFDFPLSFEQKH
jgi:hypothetical protein